MTINQAKQIAEILNDAESKAWHLNASITVGLINRAKEALFEVVLNDVKTAEEMDEIIENEQNFFPALKSLIQRSGLSKEECKMFSAQMSPATFRLFLQKLAGMNKQ